MTIHWNWGDTAFVGKTKGKNWKGTIKCKGFNPQNSFHQEKQDISPVNVSIAVSHPTAQ